MMGPGTAGVGLGGVGVEGGALSFMIFALWLDIILPMLGMHE